jgi:hypothetical protein
VRTLAEDPANIVMEEPDPALVPPLEFCERFSREILKHDWHYLWASAEANVDTLRHDERQPILDDIRRVYGVDCSDMKHLNLWRVMQRCQEGGRC